MLAKLSNDVNVETLVEYDAARLQRDWLKLEHHAHASVFQSWAWIGCWLAALPQEVRPTLLRVSSGRDVLALGMVCHASIRGKFGKAHALLLNQTGADNFDCVTIEHNGLLCDDAIAAEVLERVALTLQAQNDWDEWVIGGIDQNAVLTHYENLADKMGWTIHEFGVRPWFYIDLDEIRAGGSDYLKKLSVNTRYQVRRAVREYAKRGDVKIEAADSIGTALDFFDRLKQLHQRYWQARGKPGAFGQAFFEEFHRRFIQHGWASGGVQLLRVSAGDHEIGYLYNFTHAQTVYAYQSGFNYEDDAKIKPGLVSHALAIQRAAAQGYAHYDLLAGDGQYKRSLATHSENMRWIRLRRPRMAFRMEALARKVRDQSRRGLSLMLNREVGT